MALKELKQTTRKRFQQQTRQVAIATPQRDTRSQILTALGRFAEAGSEAANTEIQKQIESDKIRQAERASQDLMRGIEERQGITEDSTKAGQLAYNMIVGKHDTMQAGNQFLEWYSQNPDADDKAVAEKKQELYQPLMDKYGTNPHTLKAISLQVQDSQFSITQAQTKIKMDYQSKKADEALTISIGDLLENPNADIQHLVDVEIPARAKALGKGEFDYKAALVKEAASRAGGGDNRLLSFLQKADWSKSSPALERAQRDYDSFVARENAEVIGDTMGDIEIQALSGDVSWEHTVKRIEQLNNRFPRTYTPDRIASLKKQRKKAIDKQVTMTNISVDASKPFTDENAIPLGLNTKYTPTEKKDYIKSMEVQWSGKTQTYQDAGYSASQANTAVLKEKLDFSRVNRVTIPSLKDNLTALINFNPEDTTEEDLPPYISNALQVINMMDDSSLSMYFTDKDILAMANNIKTGLRNRSPYSAFRRAYDIRRNPFSVNNEKRQEQRDAVADVVNEQLNAKWYQFGKEDAPEWQRDKLANSINEEAMSYLYRSGTDTEQNAKTATSSFLANYSQTFNNTLVNKSKPELAQSIGVRPEMVDKYMKHFTEQTLSQLDVEVNPSDVEFVVNDTGTTFIMIDKFGEQVGNARFLMSDIKQYGEKGEAERLTTLATEKAKERDLRLQEEREAEEEAAHMALFYQQWQTNKGK